MGQVADLLSAVNPMCNLASRMRRLVPVLVLLAFGQAPAESAPIASGASSPEQPAAAPWTRLSETELVGWDAARLDALSEPGTLTSPLLRPGEAARGRATEHGFGGGLPDDVGSSLGGNTTVDALRAFIDVAPAAGTSDRRARQPSAPGNPTAGLDLGPEANQWLQDAFKGFVNSVLQLDVNERGRTSFSVLGLGEFNISVSGDRSEVALVAGDSVLLRAHRVAQSAESAGRPRGVGSANTGWGGASGHGGASGGVAYGESPLKQAIDLVMEIASHPLSLMVYVIVACYVLIWSLLSRQSRGKQRSVKPHADPQHAATARSRTRRRRHRVRRHRHA